MCLFSYQDSSEPSIGKKNLPDVNIFSARSVRLDFKITLIQNAGEKSDFDLFVGNCVKEQKSSN